MPPVKKVKGGWKVVSYATGKTLKRTYKTKKAAEKRAATSRRRSQRKRHRRKGRKGLTKRKATRRRGY